MFAGRGLGHPARQNEGVELDQRVGVPVFREGPVGIVVLLGVLVADADAGPAPPVEAHDGPERLARAPVVDLHGAVSGSGAETGIVPVVLAAIAAPFVR